MPLVAVTSREHHWNTGSPSRSAPFIRINVIDCSDRFMTIRGTWPRPTLMLTWQLMACPLGGPKLWNQHFNLLAAAALAIWCEKLVAIFKSSAGTAAGTGRHHQPHLQRQQLELPGNFYCPCAGHVFVPIASCQAKCVKWAVTDVASNKEECCTLSDKILNWGKKNHRGL